MQGLSTFVRNAERTTPCGRLVETVQAAHRWGRWGPSRSGLGEVATNRGICSVDRLRPVFTRFFAFSDGSFSDLGGWEVGVFLRPLNKTESVSVLFAGRSSSVCRFSKLKGGFAGPFVSRRR